MYGVVTPFWSVIALLSDDKNSAVNRNLTSVMNNWNHSSKSLINYIFAWSNELLIWFKIKISDNCFNFIGGIDL